MMWSLFILLASLPLLEVVGIELTLAQYETPSNVSSRNVKFLVKYKDRSGKFSSNASRNIFRHVGVGLIDEIASHARSVSTKRKIASIEVSEEDLENAIKDLSSDDDVEEFEEVRASFDFTPYLLFAKSA